MGTKEKKMLDQITRRRNPSSISSLPSTSPSRSRNGIGWNEIYSTATSEKSSTSPQYTGPSFRNRTLPLLPLLTVLLVLLMLDVLRLVAIASAGRYGSLTVGARGRKLVGGIGCDGLRGKAGSDVVGARERKPPEATGSEARREGVTGASETVGARERKVMPLAVVAVVDWDGLRG
jgi:hypothetical protein